MACNYPYFVGGAFGAMVRAFGVFLLSPLIKGFPTGVLVANLLASFFCGWGKAHHLMKNVSDEFILLVGAGVMGGMFGFLSFTYAALYEMPTVGYIFVPLLSILISMVGGYIAIWTGMNIARKNST